MTSRLNERKGNLGAHAMKRVAAAVHFPSPWLFEPAKRPDDRADNCLGGGGAKNLPKRKGSQ